MSGKPQRAFRHDACRNAAARTAMEAARRALDEPGIEPGDDAWAEHEQQRLDSGDTNAAQRELPLRVDR
jgi:hypothetical protein